MAACNEAAGMLHFLPTVTFAGGNKVLPHCNMWVIYRCYTPLERADHCRRRSCTYSAPRTKLGYTTSVSLSGVGNPWRVRVSNPGDSAVTAAV